MLRPYTSRLMSHLLGKRYPYTVDLLADFLSMAMTFWVLWCLSAPIFDSTGLIFCMTPIYFLFAALLLAIPVNAVIGTARFQQHPATESVLLSSLPDVEIFRAVVYACVLRFRRSLLGIIAIAPLMLFSFNMRLPQSDVVVDGFALCQRSLLGTRYCTPRSGTMITSGMRGDINAIVTMIVGIGPSIGLIVTILVGVLIAVGLEFRLRDSLKAGLIGLIANVTLSLVVILLSSELYTYMLADSSPVLLKLITGIAYSTLYAVIPLLLMHQCYQTFPRWVRLVI